jgi:predicted Rossmann-fold nucleotide-binding protein
MPTEIDTLTALDRALADRASLAGLRLQDLDLRAREEQLLALDDFEGLVVLGGELSPRLEHHLRLGRAIIFPTGPRCPVDPYRARLYTPHELYEGLDREGYTATPDNRAYRWSLDTATRHDAFVSLLRAIHDDSIGDALDELVAGRRVVGVMGGHAVERGSQQYAAAARLGHALAEAGLLVATGGGPGAMEAANLGAYCRTHDRLDAALAALAAVPSFLPDVGAWAAVALDVRDEIVRDGGPARSVGVPTWFYGHEPPNVFGDGIAKFFSNALREDGLLARCNAGVVVLPGAAGTVQEIFQATTRLYYGVGVDLAPLVLVGRDHWSSAIPVWPTLEALGAQREMAQVVHLVDSLDEAVQLLTA